MSVIVRLQRGGRTNLPFYTIVAADSRRSRDGRYLERLGHYNPKARGNDVAFVLNQEALNAWISKGAQLSDTVTRLLVKNGIASDKQAAAHKTRKDRRIKAEAYAKDFAAKREAAKAAKEGAPAVEEAPAETPAAEAAPAPAEAPAAEAPAAEEAPKAE